MPSHQHATLTEMFRHRPAFAVELVSGLLGTPLPAYIETNLGTAEAVGLRTTEHRADAVVLLGDGTDTVGAVIVEVQLRRDEAKQWTWPHYVSSVRQRWKCPAALLVVCTDQKTARWAARPIGLGNADSFLRPAVLGPERVPKVTDPAAARGSPELTVLSAITHGDDDGSFTVVDVLAEALASVETDHAVEYARLVLSLASNRVRAHLEELMSAETYEYQTEYFRNRIAKGVAAGVAEGVAETRIKTRAELVLRILERRRIDVPTAARARITECTDLAQLDTWFDRAITAATVDELFV